MRPTEWLRVGWVNARNLGHWARDYWWAGLRLAGGAASWLLREDPADWQEAGAGTGIPVVLIPGVYETWRMMRPVASALRRAGHPVHVVRSIRLNNRDLATEAARVAAYVMARPGLDRFAVVAHSKGGLVGKALLLDPAIGPRIAVVVTIATPFAGSSWADFAVPGIGIRSLGPRSRDVRRLAAEARANRRIVALIPRWDPHIPDQSEVPGGRNIPLRAAGHFAPLGSAEVHRHVLAAVAAA
ncbi:MAG: alpha/beta hydrolase [Actinomycetales bacterium]|nr:alpha/beta hydrolase [Actinomycetales bacterium]